MTGAVRRRVSLLLHDEGGWIQFLPLALSLLHKVGGVASGASKGRADARALEAQIASNRDRNAIDLFGTQDRGAVDRYGIEDRGAVDRYGINQKSILEAMGLTEKGTMDRAALDLQQRKFQAEAPQVRGKTALMGDMLNRGSNMTISHPRATIPTFSGGYTWDSMSPEVRQMGRTMTLQALQKQQAGDVPVTAPMQNFTGGVMPPPAATPVPPMSQVPQMSSLPQSGKFDSFLNVLGGIGGVSGAIGGSIADFINGRRQPYNDPNAWA